MTKNSITFCLIIYLFLTIFDISSQTQEIYPIAFYNLENLFDTLKDPNTNDDEFTPDGKKNWTEDKYKKKLQNLSLVINRLATEIKPSGADIIGVAEVENRKVLEDLVNQKDIIDKDYKIIHVDSPDPRGIDVALLYISKIFHVNSYKIYPYTMPGNNKIKTRDILLVSGILANEPLYILVNHWPSRKGENSPALRERAAGICKQICDSISKISKQANIIIMGDMNDNPKDKSTSVVLNAKKNKSEVKESGLYNTMWNIHESGTGTLCYRGQWNLFDQIIISKSLISDNRNKLTFWKAEVFNKDFLFQKEGKYKGYPLRTFSGDTFLNGYSDHFPTLIYLRKNK